MESEEPISGKDEVSSKKCYMAFKVQGVNQIDIVEFDDISNNSNGSEIKFKIKNTVKFPRYWSKIALHLLSEGSISSARFALFFAL